MIGASSLFVIFLTKQITWPMPLIFSFSAAALDRSITRLPMYGPLSVTTTSTFLPLCGLKIRSLVPNGSVLWAQVSLCMSYMPPEAVRRPWKLPPYQEAMPPNSLCRSSPLEAKAGASKNSAVRARQAIKIWRVKENPLGP